MNTVRDTLSTNLEQIRRRIADACHRARRPIESVHLVAVVKSARIEWIRELAALGVNRVAENRPQQLLERAALLADVTPPLTWDLIGHLQSNKVRKILPVVGLIHAVDSLKLLETIERIAEECNCSPRVLLEVNVSRESAKHGFDPEHMQSLWSVLSQYRRTQVQGLMTMAPHTGSLEDARQAFRELRQLRDAGQAAKCGHPLTELSMGMTADFEVAIEEGATLVRIGSALFEGL